MESQCLNFKTQLYLSLSVWSWSSSLTWLCLSFLVLQSAKFSLSMKCNTFSFQTLWVTICWVIHGFYLFMSYSWMKIKWINTLEQCLTHSKHLIIVKYIYVLYSIYIFICKLHINFKVFLVAHMVKNLPAVQETWVWSLGQEDPLEKRMATRCSILAWRIPWTEEPGRLYSPWSHKELDMTEQLTLTFTYLYLLLYL